MSCLASEEDLSRVLLLTLAASMTKVSDDYELLPPTCEYAGFDSWTSFAKQARMIVTYMMNEDVFVAEAALENNAFVARDRRMCAVEDVARMIRATSTTS